MKLYARGDYARTGPCVEVPGSASLLTTMTPADRVKAVQALVDTGAIKEYEATLLLEQGGSDE